MKKFALASAVIVVYGLYSLHAHSEGDSRGVALRPATSTQNTSKAATSSSAAGNGGSSSNSSASSASSSQTTSATYKDGQYTGSVADAIYGNIQVKAIIQGGKITDVKFLQYPSDRSNSIYINQQAMPLLKQEAVQVQSAQVDIISGATDSSQAFVQSLSDALSQAHS
jgi:uncharacterized protein with FMN-binding domain